eukprot:scaffold485514_cov49-Prasinocladus_malaysianus.AAC.1
MTTISRSSNHFRQLRSMSSQWVSPSQAEPPIYPKPTHNKTGDSGDGRCGRPLSTIAKDVTSRAAEVSIHWDTSTVNMTDGDAAASHQRMDEKNDDGRKRSSDTLSTNSSSDNKVDRYPFRSVEEHLSRSGFNLEGLATMAELERQPMHGYYNSRRYMSSPGASTNSVYNSRPATASGIGRLRSVPPPTLPSSTDDIVTPTTVGSPRRYMSTKGDARLQPPYAPRTPSRSASRPGTTRR